MTIYDLVVIADRETEAARWCMQWTEGKPNTTIWAGIRPDMLRHFAGVGARSVVDMTNLFQMDAGHRRQAAELLARGRTQPTEAA